MALGVCVASKRRAALAQVMAAANKLSVAYAPYKVSGHRVITDLVQPGVIGYRSKVFVPEFWKYVDIDRALPQRSAR